MKIIKLTWVDSSCYNEWVDLEDINPNLHIKSVGYLVKETKKTITISCAINCKIMNPLTIPKCSIIKRKYL